MVKEKSSNQLNLTVVALVALVAIVGLVALVMNAASVKTAQLATGSKLASAQNAAGLAKEEPYVQDTGDAWGVGGGGNCKPIGETCTSGPTCCSGWCSHGYCS